MAALQGNARLSNVDLAGQVGLSQSPCLRRVRNLEQGGVIKGYVALVDQQAVGLPVSVFVSVSLERQVERALETFEAAIRARPEVMECYLMTGDADYLLRVVAADLTAYERFLMDHLTRIEGVASIRSSFALKQVALSDGTADRRRLTDPIQFGLMDVLGTQSWGHIMHRFLILVLFVCFAGQPASANLLDDLKKTVEGAAKSDTSSGSSAGSDLSTGDITAGLKEALKVGSDRVLGQVGQTDGFNLDDNIHIPLPKQFQDAQQLLRHIRAVRHG